MNEQDEKILELYLKDARKKKIFLYERIRYQENMYKQYVRMNRKK